MAECVLVTGVMAKKHNMREVAQKISEGQIDPDSRAGREIVAEIVERVFRRIFSGK